MAVPRRQVPPTQLLQHTRNPGLAPDWTSRASSFGISRRNHPGSTPMPAALLEQVGHRCQTATDETAFIPRSIVAPMLTAVRRQGDRSLELDTVAH